MQIGASNKGGYLTGETKKPDPTDPRREVWITKNHRVKSSDDHIFLSGLDPVFDQLRGEFLRKEPKLELEHAYTAVRRDYS